MTVTKGQEWRRLGMRFRIMGVIEGDVVYRYKGGSPEIMWWREFEKEFVLTEND